MTERLYYDDAYTVAFEATVLERTEVAGRPAVVLERTYFYPTGGGQPFDTGTVGGVEVVEVVTREADGAVLHVLAEEVAEETVQCGVDWARRFDHMQHHTGQHVLTQAFVTVAEAMTVGFHLSPDSVTIDLDTTTLSEEEITAAEDLANRVVMEDRPVRVRLVDAASEEAAEVRKRGVPTDLKTEGLRVIDIEDFDATACGGTHVARTGEIGVIKIIKLERQGEQTRVEFRCGQRALEDYRVKNRLIIGLAADFTVGFWEVDEAVARLQDELKATRSSLKQARKQLLDVELADLVDSAVEREGARVVRRAFEGRDVGEVRELARRLIEHEGMVALMGVAGEKAQLILARSEDLPHDLRDALKAGLDALGTDRGGGRPEFVQGGGVEAGREAVEKALEAAEAAVFGGQGGS